VVKISFDIDLRSPESRARTKLLKPRAMKLLIWVMIMLMLALLCFTLQSYKAYLISRIGILESRLEVLAETAEPLKGLIAETEALEKRLELVDELGDFSPVKTDYLWDIIKSAPRESEIIYLSINTDGVVELKGSCLNLQDAARYCRSLSALPFINESELLSAALQEKGQCAFSIQAVITDHRGGELPE
jgi:Tfp pilus assembly protein PilN